MPNIVLSRPLFQLLCISWRGYRNAEMSIYLSVSLSLGVIAPNCMHFVLLRFPHHAPLAVIKKTLKQRQLLMVTNGSSNAHEKTYAKLKTRCDSLWPSRLYTRSLSIHKNVKQKSVNIIWNSEGPANPTFHVLGGSERASTDCSHPIVLCPWVTLMRFSWKLSTSMVFMFFCTNLCLLPFDAAGSKCLVQLGPSWQSQRTAKQDQQRNIYAQLRWTRHMLTWFYWDGEIFLSFRFAALQTKAGNAISLHALSPRSRVQTFAASPPVNEMKGNYLGIFLLTHVGFRLGSVGLIDSMKPRQGTTYSVRNKKKCVKLKGNHEGKTHQEAKHGKVKGQKTKCKN